MSIQTISNEALNNVVGAASLGGAVCRGAMTGVGAGLGAAIGAGGIANPLGAVSTAVNGGLNVGGEAAAGRPGAAAFDTAMAGAALVPGPVGAIGGAYTHGKAWYNAADVICPK